MMDGKNSSGRKISLLNDSSDVGPLFAKASHHSLPPLSAAVHSHPHQQHHHTLNSRASSCTSTPSLSPQTPQLVRSDSSDSRAHGSPSPSTPSFASYQDQLAYFQQQRSQQHYYIVNARSAKMDDAMLSMYPPLDTGVNMPMAYPIPAQMPLQQIPQPAQPPYRSSTSPSSEPSRVSTVSANSNSNAKAVAPKKNQYPCPLAKQYSCSDFFTTSGHAARHAKKHTGKKDAFCPECNKAFTRKDNMEQHRRTHQNGRGGSRVTGNDDSKVRKPVKAGSKKPIIKSEPVLEAIEQELVQQQQQPLEAPMQPQPTQMPMHTLPQDQPLLADPTMLIPPVGGPYYIGGGMDTGPIPPLPMPTMNDNMMRPPLHRSNFTNTLDYMPPAPMMMSDQDFSYPSPGLSNGLNSLALAASEHRRWSEEKTRSPSSDDSTP